MAQTARGSSCLQIGRGLASLRASVITAPPRGMFSRLHSESLGGESLLPDCIVHAFLTATPNHPPNPPRLESLSAGLRIPTSSKIVRTSMLESEMMEDCRGRGITDGVHLQVLDASDIYNWVGD